VRQRPILTAAIAAGLALALPAAANGLPNPDRLRPGQRLSIPGAAARLVGARSLWGGTDPRGPGPSHAGISIGNNRFAHASSGFSRVTVTSMDYRCYRPRSLGVRRV